MMGLLEVSPVMMGLLEVSPVMMGLLAVVGLPSDLDELDAADRRRVDRFLHAARRRGVA